MESNVEQARRKYQEVYFSNQEISLRNTALRERIEEIETEKLPQLRKALEAAEASKYEMLDSYAVGDAEEQIT